MRWALCGLLLAACADDGQAVSVRADCRADVDCPRGLRCLADGVCGRRPADLGVGDAAPAPDARVVLADAGLVDVVDAAPGEEAGEEAGAPDLGPVEDGGRAPDATGGEDAALDAAAAGECARGQRRDCGRSVGLCRRGAEICGEDGRWGPCEGGVQPAEEVCNLADDDCNGVVDDGFGVGLPCEGVGACGEGLVECRDAVRTRCSTDPGGSEDQSASERCDGRDDDCDGAVDDGLGVGGDCVGRCGPGAMECDVEGALACSTDPGGSESAPRDELCNGRDDDCDGAVDEGFDVGAPCEGVGRCGAGTRECDEAGGTRCSTDPGGTEDGAVEEICDGLDDDCDGEVDEGFGLGGACEGQGVCGVGALECDAAGDILCSTDPGGSASQVAVERCNGVDDDCDGAVDEGLGLGEPCPAVGRCEAAALACGPEGAVVCATGPGGPRDQSAPERCDGQDDDCDGAVDEGFDLGARCEGVGVCGVGVRECDGAGGAQCSTEPGGSADAAQPEICNALDDDCDGAVDEGAACGGDTCDTAPLLPLDAVGAGNTSQLADDYTRANCLGATLGRDQLFRVEVPAAGPYAVGVAPLAAGYDPVFWLANHCGAPESCVAGARSARQPAGRPEALRIELPRADRFVLAVDSREDGDGGPFVTTVRPWAAGERCREAIELPVPGRFVGTTEGRANDLTTRACPAGVVTFGPDQIFGLSLAAPARLRLTLTTADDVDAVLAVLSDCSEPDATCAGGANAGGRGRPERLDVELAAGHWFVVVDHAGNPGGPFYLEVAERP